MIECLYSNNSDKMVILKCIGERHFYREKVVMAHELFWFEAPSNSRLEIWKMSSQGQMLEVRADVSDYALNAETTSVKVA
ncbi:DUF1830 domain-containing protein [Synechococcus sp. CS-197]|uniref:DUF1830 domain-containing protein n=1 Tax=Synechococcus sp. CS-197 TaxID=2847985 RepID=UPI0001525CF1|nr:DUF1830 domain-containing protein [Synechococcus sp. CS-197]MCT0251059.1 DUF1830 domain-containing protein [Synechococcus sp. CS-197]CAK24902.1 Conserved hypothetical protein specific to cyanobacteria [Synechococcus sp. WH 7803]